MLESLLYLCAIVLVVTTVNLAVFGVVCFLIRRIAHRAVRVIIPVLVVLAGYCMLMKADPANLIIGTHFFVAPMAVLLLALLIPGLADPFTDLTRVILGDFFVSIIAVVVLGFVISSQYLNTVQYYQNLALSNGITYAGVIVFDLVLAFVIFRLMRRERRKYPVRVKSA